MVGLHGRATWQGYMVGLHGRATWQGYMVGLHGSALFSRINHHYVTT